MTTDTTASAVSRENTPAPAQFVEDRIDELVEIAPKAAWLAGPEAELVAVGAQVAWKNRRHLPRLLISVTALLAAVAILATAGVFMVFFAPSSKPSSPSVKINATGATGLAIAAWMAGFRNRGLLLAVAVGLAESGGNPVAVGRDSP